MPKVPADQLNVTRSPELVTRGNESDALSKREPSTTTLKSSCTNEDVPTSLSTIATRPRSSNRADTTGFDSVGGAAAARAAPHKIAAAIQSRISLTGDAEYKSRLRSKWLTGANDGRRKVRVVGGARKMLRLEAEAVAMVIATPAFADHRSIEKISGLELHAGLRRRHVQRTAGRRVDQARRVHKC